MEKLVGQMIINKLPEDNVVVGEDLALFSFKHFIDELEANEPRKLQRAAIVLCTAGSCRIKINLEEHEITSPQLVTFMPGQIFELLSDTNDLEGYVISISKRFIDKVNLPGWQHQYMKMYNNPITDINEEMLNSLRIFYAILYRAAKNDKNPFRQQIIENLISVFYYGGVSSLDNEVEPNLKYKNHIVANFLELVQQHYREERLIQYYAGRLCITPKYLSKLVKEHTGRAATDWIEQHVVLEARAMLQSSDMSIQQIAASLNFPNQSFFGKYFKRATGVSPKQYRTAK
ncbi:MAG: AraC family transcriptional regulator [Alistipes sp.]|nr:AraC family transcriptional regulator [Alistipes sp.]